jgi:cytoskeleton protein RodZ
MASVGNYLRELRQRRGLSLDEISRATRVAPRYLEALEADQFTALPAPVFTRGFIRAYCHAVGETADEALAHYDDRGGQPSLAARLSAAPPPAASTADGPARSRGAIAISAGLVVVLGAALFAVALVTQPGGDDRAERRAPPTEQLASSTEPSRTTPAPATPAVPSTTSRSSTSGVAPPSPPSSPVGTAAARPGAPAPSTVASAPSVAPSPMTATAPPPTSRAVAPPPVSPSASAPSSTPAPAPASSASAPTADSAAAASAPAWLPNVQAVTGGVASPYRLVARVSEPTWIRVRTDDGRNTEETIPAGQTREWVSNRPFVLTLGNAGGVTLELNGRTLPPLGPSGAVISRIVLPPQ